jgi:hypothetical protein
MPDTVSGLTISHPKVGPFIVINDRHSRERRRFSWCHGYAHVLLDKDTIGMVSRESQRNDLREVRANSVAANFLLPDEGVRQFVASLGKGAVSRIHADIFDEVGVVAIDSRTDPATQEIQVYAVVQLAHSYGVSVPSTFFTPRNLKLVSEPKFEHLRTIDGERQSKKIASAFGVETDESLEQRGEFQRRFLALGLGALRREKISYTKLLQFAERVGVRQWIVQDLLVAAGIDDAEALCPPAGVRMFPPGSPPFRVVVTDTNILINLIHVGLLELLGKLPPYPFVAPEEVVKEVTDSHQTQALQTALSSGRLLEVQLTDPSELKVYADLEVLLFPGLK